jgi:hypothetical protein
MTADARRAVARGAVVQLAVALPPVLVVRALLPECTDSTSYLPVAALLIALAVAPAVGAGAVVAARTASPVRNALMAAGLAWLAHSVITIVRSVATDTCNPLVDVLVPLPFIGLVEGAVASATAFLLTTRRRQPAP